MEFWTGNIAIAEGALKARCGFYAGYPITPSSDLMEYMARELPKRGGVFIQAEDEIAAINMVIGASIAGLKAMTATSGPGYSLMQEGLGYAIMTEVPVVVVNVTRLGPATGQATKAGQGDVMQARWGRHGDQYSVVLSPASVSECFKMAIEAFNISEMLRVPVTILVDELIAHLWESVDIPGKVDVIDRIWASNLDIPPFGSDEKLVTPMHPIGKGFNVLYTGSTHDFWGFRKTQDPETHEKLVNRLKQKVFNNINKIFFYEIYGNDPPYDVGIVTYGSIYLSTIDAVRKLKKHVKVAVLKLNTLWPMDYDILEEFANSCHKIIVPELNLGQIIYDIYAVKDRRYVYPFNKVGGGRPVFPEDIYNYIQLVI